MSALTQTETLGFRVLTAFARVLHCHRSENTSSSQRPRPTCSKQFQALLLSQRKVGLVLTMECLRLVNAVARPPSSEVLNPRSKNSSIAKHKRLRMRSVALSEQALALALALVGVPAMLAARPEVG